MKSTLITIFSLALISLGHTFPRPARAELLEDLHRTARPLAMGDAFTAVAEGSNAFFYNPAGLANSQAEEWRIEAPTLSFELTARGISILSDFLGIDKENLGEVTDLIEDNLGEPFRAKVALFPNATHKNFGMGLLLQTTVDARFRNPVNPQVRTRIAADIGPFFGASYGLLNDTLLFGFCGKILYRLGLDRVYTAVDIAGEDFSPLDDLDGNLGFGIDLGAMYTLAQAPWTPTIGLVVQNIGDIDFGEAGTIPMAFNIGLAAHPKVSILDITLALDFKDLLANKADDSDFWKRVHLGSEVRFTQGPTWLSVGIGINQGYLTGGVGITYKSFRLDIATYGEEAGAYAGQREDRRLIMQLNFDF